MSNELRTTAVGFVFSLLLGGCGASLVTSTRGTRGAEVGVVKYLNQGMGAVIDSRRQSALELMQRDCGGAYEIVWERSFAEAIHYRLMGPDLRDYGSATENQDYWYIGYVCEHQRSSARR